MGPYVCICPLTEIWDFLREFIFLNCCFRLIEVILMCVLLHLLICTALRAHIIVVEALYKILSSVRLLRNGTSCPYLFAY